MQNRSSNPSLARRRLSAGANQPALLLGIGLAILIGVVAWAEITGYRAMVAHQRQLAVQSVRTVSDEIAAYLRELRRVDGLLLRDHAVQFAELATHPDDESLHTALGRRLAAYHDEYYAFTLADSRGQVLYEDLGTHVGPRCRQTIRAFATEPDAVSVQIHPGPDVYHIDVLQTFPLADGAPGVFFASYRPDHIARLLARGAVENHRLVLVRRDLPDLIEVTARGARNTLGDHFHLSVPEQQQVALIGASTEVPGSNWLLLDLPRADHLARELRDSWLRAGAIVAAVLLYGLFTWRQIRQEAQHRRQAEWGLRDARAQLEWKVAQRTRDLTQANAELAAQIARREQAEVRMTQLSRAVEHTGDSIIICNREGRIEYVNPAFERITGRSAKQLLGTALASLQSAHEPAEFMQQLWQQLAREHAFREIFCTRNAAGESCYTEQTITAITDASGQVSQLIATGKDITERMDSQRRLSYLAHHDTLTGLPNRALMFDRLEHALARARRKDTLVALLFMDIDRFKTINDSLGHQAGDELLVAVAERLRASVRRSDSIARLGGDEFVAILEDIRQPDEPVHVAKTILGAIARPLTLTGHEVSVSSSMGIALYPADGSDSNGLLQCADAAMYKAKAAGGDTYNFYTADMTAEAQRRLSLETRLRHALKNGEFRLLYQPRQDLASGAVTAVEALLRWSPPGEPTLGPAEFMPVLEETGLIREVGEWVLQQSCTDFARVQGAGHQLRMACNLSAKQFRDQHLVEIIDRTVADQAMHHTDLELEITEELLAGDADHAGAVLAALRDRGVRISVDDFGTGYSSMASLKRFPIDDLKVDQSFVQHITDDRDDATIVTAIISLAHSLGLGAVAEGVETTAQLQTLGLLGCDEAQGMLVSEPLGIEALLDWLDARHGAVA